MLDRLSLTNFRAFKLLDLPFSKINIFVGPNNSGKSSIVSAINLIAQNVRRGARQNFTLALNGSYAELGTFHDVINGHKATSKMKIGFSLSGYDYEYQFRYRPQKREIELVKANVESQSTSYEYATTKDGIRQTFRHGKGVVHFATQQIKPRFYGLYLVLPVGQLAYEQGLGAVSEAFHDLRRLAVRSMTSLENHFTSFDSVGAFRAAPQRTYLYTGEAPEEVGRFGENFAQMIASMASSRDRASIATIGRINKWFSESGIAGGIEIKSLTNRHFELCVKDRTGSSNNIVDAGFGCSQVLPVIVGGYRLENYKRRPGTPIFVVQEPEIHLHPSGAAHLGSYFVDLALRGVQCFVETHSENIILRVARHVAAGHLSPDDVRIYWVSDTVDGREVTALGFHPDGSFSMQWPDGFFPTRANEVMDLARLGSGLPTSDQLELSFAR